MQRSDPVLSLAVENISKIDKVDCDRLSSLWTVFTKCAGNLENGHRLENLSWRLWYRECRLLEHERFLALKQSSQCSSLKQVKGIPNDSYSILPALSTSVESEESDIDQSSNNKARSATHSSTGRHLTPNKFHELVTQFGQASPRYRDWSPTPNVPRNTHFDADSTQDLMIQVKKKDEGEQVGGPNEVAENGESENADTTGRVAHLTPSQLQNKVENDMSQVLRRASSVVHGFNPTFVSVKQGMDQLSRSQGGTCISSNASKSMFFIDSSPSDSDHEDQGVLSGRVSGRLSGRDRSKAIRSSNLLPPKSGKNSPDRLPAKRHTSFKEVVDEGSEYESSPFDTDDESDYECSNGTFHGESAILSDEDEQEIIVESGDTTKQVENDEDEWDSVCSESRNNSPHSSAMFDKLSTDEPRPGLVSRKSILSSLLTNPMVRIANAQSRSSPAISQSQKTSPRDTPHNARFLSNNNNDNKELTVIRTSPTIIKGSVSPRTTRRNMLATELSESLRRHLLWERKQKSVSSGQQISNTVLQRRHTAYDLTQIQAFPRVSSSCDSKQKLELITDNEFGYNGAGW